MAFYSFVEEGRGHLRHGGETTNVDAQVGDLLVGSSLRLMHEDNAGDEKDQERHCEGANPGGADLQKRGKA